MMEKKPLPKKASLVIKDAEPEETSLEEPKAEVEIYVKYLGEEYEIFDELDVSCGLGEAVLDAIAGLDYDIRVARIERSKLKAALKEG